MFEWRNSRVEARLGQQPQPMVAGEQPLDVAFVRDVNSTRG
jgi:hypothetical protein